MGTQDQPKVPIPHFPPCDFEKAIDLLRASVCSSVRRYLLGLTVKTTQGTSVTVPGICWPGRHSAPTESRRETNFFPRKALDKTNME